MEKDVDEMKRMVNTYQQNIKEIDTDMKDSSGGQGDKEKYEILY